MAVLETSDESLNDLLGYAKLSELLAKMIAFINSQAGKLEQVQASVAAMQGKLDEFQSTAARVAGQAEQSSTRLEAQRELAMRQAARIDEQETSIAKLQDVVSMLQSQSETALLQQQDMQAEHARTFKAELRTLSDAQRELAGSQGARMEEQAASIATLQGAVSTLRGQSDTASRLQLDLQTELRALMETVARDAVPAAAAAESIGTPAATAVKPELVDTTPPAAAVEPESDDEMPVALRKIYPARPPAELEAAAEWLKQSFGVASYCDISGAGSWAEAGMSLVDGDCALSEGGKEVLRELLASRALGDPDHGLRPPTMSSTLSPGLPATLSALAPTRRDDFRVLARLGEGTFAVVHKVAEHTAAGEDAAAGAGCERNFALKEINLARLRDEALRAQAEQEASIHLGLDHPHILRCHETFEVGTSLFLLLELAEGGVFWKFMRARKVLKEVEAARFYSEVAQGVHYLHLVDVMHRDLKPENILLDAGQHAKIADFGWSCRVSSNLTAECGTTAYLAPEMVAKEGYDQQVDVWALGILLYEMLVGYSPFSSALTEKEIRRRIGEMDFGYGAWLNVPAAAQPLIKNLLRRNPGERPALLDTMEDAWLTTHVGTAALEAARILEQENCR